MLTGAIGFGGFFAVYSYVAPIMEHVAGVPRSGIPIVLALFGIGMTVGNFAGGRIADHSVNAAILGGFAATIAVLALFTVAVHEEIAAVLVLMLLGVTPSIIVPGLQTGLMDVSADAQSLAAALNHSALNIANSLGAWLGGRRDRRRLRVHLDRLGRRRTRLRRAHDRRCHDRDRARAPHRRTAVKPDPNPARARKLERSEHDRSGTGESERRAERALVT